MAIPYSEAVLVFHAEEVLTKKAMFAFDIEPWEKMHIPRVAIRGFLANVQGMPSGEQPPPAQESAGSALASLNCSALD